MAELDAQAAYIPSTNFNATRNYGVYLQRMLQDAIPEEPVSELVVIAPDFNMAYESLRNHASDEIGQHANWGATREITNHNITDIIDSNHDVQLRYEIEAIRCAENDDEGQPIWKRESEWLAENYAGRPPVHHGLFVDMPHDGEDQSTQLFLGGFSNMGEASTAMKASAQAYLQENSGVNVYESSIVLKSETGEMRQRYVILKGRWQGGAFVKEEDWVVGEKKLRDLYGETPPPESQNADGKGWSSVIRLPTPEVSSSVKGDASPLRQFSELQDTDGEEPASGPGLDVELPLELEPESELEDKATPEPLPAVSTPGPTLAVSTPGPTFAISTPVAAHLSTPVAAPGTPGTPSIDPTRWCTCHQPDDGLLMLACDDTDCAITWYHGRCLNVTIGPAPDEDWFCPTCAAKPKNKMKIKMKMKAPPKQRKATVAVGSRTGAGVTKKRKKR
jgi:hypothetical protein